MKIKTILAVHSITNSALEPVLCGSYLALLRDKYLHEHLRYELYKLSPCLEVLLPLYAAFFVSHLHGVHYCT